MGLSENTVEATNRLCVPDLSGEFYAHVLQRLHRDVRPKSYLEIGTLAGDTLRLAACPSIAIDPRFRIENQDVVGEKPVCLLYQMTSDDFFATYDPKTIIGGSIDLAFLDGLHLCEYLLRDFANVERACQRNSIVALHDCVPVETAIAERTFDVPRLVSGHANWWAGDVWRTVVALMRHRPDLEITALDASPTGLICITNLSPTTTTLMDNYNQIVREMLSISLHEFGILNYFSLINLQSTSVIDTYEKLAARFGCKRRD